MLTVREFFAESHRGNAFGVKGLLYGPGGHRGDDTNRWGAGTGIPSFVAGRVVASVKYVSLGWVTTVQTVLDGRIAWVSFCHEYSRGPAVGTPIGLNSWVGPIGNTGTLSLGVHVHVVVSFTSSDPRSGSVVDPRPYINRAKAATAGSGGAPIFDDPETTALTEGGTNVTQVIYTQLKAGIADADPRLAKLRSYCGGDTLTNFSAGVQIVALVGDSPGSYANVQLTQADVLIRRWLADNTGTIPSGPDQTDHAGGGYELDAFLARCDAYLTPLAPAGSGGSFPASVELGAASIEALAKRIDEYSDGRA